MLSVIRLNVIMLCVVRLNVVMLSVVAPLFLPLLCNLEHSSLGLCYSAYFYFELYV